MIQLQFINYILKTKDSSLITLNNLDSRYFSEYKTEFKYILAHLNKYGCVPDIETFLNVFPEFEVIDVNETQQYLLDELLKDYRTHKMADTFNKVKNLLLSEKVDDAMAVFQKSSEELSTSGVSLNCVDLIQDTSRYDAYVERTKDYTKYYLSTGFPELDKVIGGIDREEELGVVVARTNLGKSWVLTKMAVAAAMQGLTVGLYSGEMSERKVGYRVDTLIGHIHNGSLTHGNVNVQDAYKQYIDDLPNKCKGSLKVLTPKMISGSAGVNALKAFIEKEHLDILFIDQLSLLEDDRHAKVPFERASNISKDLKNLQVMKRIPIISVSQQNRTKNEDEGTIDTTQLAMSDRIAQDATFILGITRDKKDNTIMNIHVVKSRDSANGQKITYVVDFGKGEFNYVPDENEMQELALAENYENRYDTVEEDLTEEF